MPGTSPTSFGLWLSLLAIGLTLSFLSALTAGLGLRTLPDQPYDPVEGVVQLLTAGMCLAALVLLIQRRRLFIPVMIAILAINLLVGLGVLIYHLSTDALGIDPALSIGIFVVQAVIACLWIAYLLLSDRVRAVCEN